MGTLWCFNVEGTTLQAGKNEEPLQMLSLFTSSEFVADPQWVEANRYLYEGITDDDDAKWQAAEATIERGYNAFVFGYRCGVGDLVARLDLMGFTQAACRADVMDGIRGLTEGGESAVEDHDGRGLDPAEVVERGLAAMLWHPNRRRKETVDDRCADLLEDFLYSGMDRRALLALQLADLPAETNVELDLGPLFQEGYFEGVDDIAALASEELAVQMASVGPIIVVTEGPTDAEFISKAISRVSPAVQHMFRFLDFSMRPEGGADAAVRTLRSFAAAGVTNRVVGVFDNDVAGRRATQLLERSTLPPSIRYFLLPEVDHALSYPTLGPSGPSRDDVNGKAGSIEFQFGLSSLQDNKGAPIPVRWIGFDAKLESYQGELTNKPEVHRNIRSLLDSSVDGSDSWLSVRALVARLTEVARADTFPGQER